MPDQYVDQNVRQAYIYGVDKDGNEVELAGSPAQAVGYKPTQASIDYYNNNVAGQLNVCMSCHVYNFDEAYNRLLIPLPNQGGSAGNNQLINYSSGGNGHSGGAACGGGCQSILQTWYNTSFQ